MTFLIEMKIACLEGLKRNVLITCSVSIFNSNFDFLVHFMSLKSIWGVNRIVHFTPSTFLRSETCLHRVAHSSTTQPGPGLLLSKIIEH